MDVKKWLQMDLKNCYRWIQKMVTDGCKIWVTDGCKKWLPMEVKNGYRWM